MSPDNADVMEPQPAGMGEFSRLTGVFFDPKKTFADIAMRPSFLAPLALIILFAMAYSAMLSNRIGFERVVRQQMESNERMQQMPAEQRERSIELGAKIGSVIAYAGSLIGVPLYNLVAALIIMGIANGMLSAGIKFKQMFAIMCYSGLPGIIFMALTTVVMFLKNPDDFNIQNPLAFNPGAFLDPQQTSKFLYSVASSIDVFSFWTIILIATGIRAAGRKVSFGGALMAVLIPWALWVFIRGALAGLRG